ncbi:MAG: CPBP family intramembrane metalloprotease [Clostridia bacterium]|nr:CPBP family intramembrane metalloprotease [Clostridia bacterium]
MLKRLYDKSRIWFAVGWIVLYCVLMSVGDVLSDTVGAMKVFTLVVGLLLSAILLIFLVRHGLTGEYGLCRPSASAGRMLYYLPLLVMLTANAWYGFRINYGVTESILYILSMLCVGFLEEVIFRGLLFEALRKESFKAAVIVSSVTFGVGHIINLFNGSGAELIPNLLQVVYATAAGFMFVMMYCKSKSLIACIISHGVFNATSVFANDLAATLEMRILTAILLTLICASYATYLALTLKRE